MRDKIKIALGDEVSGEVNQYDGDAAKLREIMDSKLDPAALITALDVWSSDAAQVPLLTDGMGRDKAGKPVQFLKAGSHVVLYGSYSDRGHKVVTVIPIESTEEWGSDSEMEEQTAKDENGAVQLARILID
jgi:hypothetical protein